VNEISKSFGFNLKIQFLKILEKEKLRRMNFTKKFFII